ncbi:MAG: ABC transporter permease [bacterium]|nr:ABC transporter permease [bacterium]
MKIIRRIAALLTVYRELLIHLALKNLKIQYKYAFLGFLWAFFVPLCMALVFWFIFSFLFRRPTPPLSIVTALFVWQFINMSVMGATCSIIDNAGILKKVYFPREIVPISLVLSNLINFILSLIVIVLFVLFYNMAKGQYPLFPLTVFLLPGIVLITFLFAVGLALLTSHLQVYFRDVRYVVEIVLMLTFYLSGVFYGIDDVAKAGVGWMTRLFMLNPVYDLFAMYRIVLLNDATTKAFYPTSLLVAQTTAFSVVVLYISYSLFARKEHELIDLI